jgi:hypothetical protein
VSAALGILLALAVIMVPAALVYWLLRRRYGPNRRRH